MRKPILVISCVCVSTVIAACGTSSNEASVGAQPTPTTTQAEPRTFSPEPLTSLSESARPSELESIDVFDSETRQDLRLLFTQTDPDSGFWREGSKTIVRAAAQASDGQRELEDVASRWRSAAKNRSALEKMNEKAAAGNFSPTRAQTTKAFRYISIDAPCALASLASALSSADPDAQPRWQEVAQEVPSDSLGASIVMREPELCDVNFAKGYPKFYTRAQVERRQDRLTNWKAEGRLLTSALQKLPDEIFVALDKRLYTSLKFDGERYEPFWENVREKPWYGTCDAMNEFTARFNISRAPNDSLCQFTDFR